MADPDKNWAAADLTVLDVFAVLASGVDSKLQGLATPWAGVVGINQAMHADKSHLAKVTQSTENRRS
jgi:hypothetical protein